jgi:hypothetical protein
MVDPVDVAAIQEFEAGTSETMNKCAKLHQMSCGVALWANLEKR